MINGKIYIGKTNDLVRRWKDHIKCATARKPYPLYRAIYKYGKENFTIEILEHYENETDCLTGEVNLISRYKSTDETIGYNLTKGGEGASGFIFSPESKAKIAKAHLGKKLSEQHKNNISKGFDDQDRLKQSERFRGEKSNNSKLTESQVIEIKRLLKDGLSTRQIAKMFNVGKSIIGYINRGRCWSHIEI